jgi:hypothetical protein
LVSADQSGEQLERGRTPTTHPALRELASRLGEDDDLLAGHEVGGQVYLVHDAVTAAGVTIQQEDRQARRLLDRQGAADGDDTTPGLHPQR